MERREIRDVALEFAVEVTAMCNKIQGKQVFVNQLLRSCSSIGANSFEAKYAQSDSDFVNKYEIALKECNETEYWLTLLYRTGAIPKGEFERHVQTCSNIRRKIISSIKTVKSKM